MLWIAFQIILNSNDLFKKMQWILGCYFALSITQQEMAT